MDGGHGADDAAQGAEPGDPMPGDAPQGEDRDRSGDAAGGGFEAPGVGLRGVSDDVLETSRLVLELIHAGYALEEPSRAGLPRAGVAHRERARVSRQAIRASIELYQRGELTMGALASALHMSPGWATRVVEELVTAGYAVRTGDPHDRRSVRVRLSPAALDAAGTAYRWRVDVIDQALGGMGREERAAVRAFLGRLVEQLADADL